MSYYYISITECNESGDENPRVSTLGVFDSSPDKLFVMGNLPHGYNFKPTTAGDRDKLVEFLNGLEYDAPVTTEERVNEKITGLATALVDIAHNKTKKKISGRGVS